jgi:prolyl-tRNA synthetase
VTGANEAGRHVVDLVAGRDFTADGMIDVADIRDGDPCPRCDGTLSIARGIEIGHIFKLGRRYAEALDLTVQDEAGGQVTVTMGSYGIGVSRAVPAIAEQTHDQHGLCWPRSVSPADVHVIATGKDDTPFDAAEALIGELEDAGVSVLYDDRRISAGVKFNDADLLGVPTIVVLGRGLQRGVVEVKDRANGERTDIDLPDVVAYLADLVRGG